jgi:hypothetical protein
MCMCDMCDDVYFANNIDIVNQATWHMQYAYKSSIIKMQI